MIKNISLLAVFVMAVSFCFAQGQQFRMVANMTNFPTAINDSTYTLSVNFPSDQTGNNFIPTQISSDGSYRMFFQGGKVYAIKNVENATFLSADLTLEEYGETEGAPSGQALAYDPQGRETVPSVPSTASGASPVLGTLSCN